MLEYTTIQEVILDLLKCGKKPAEIADTVGVSSSMISIWRNKSNDFVPRLDIARKFYKEYGYTIYPYAEYALEDD